MTSKYLKIKEVKDLVRFFANNFNIDFSQYAYVSFKIKVEQFLEINKISEMQSFMERLEFNETFRKDFFSHIFNYEFELFRDPALWRCIKEEILRNIKTDFQFRVLFPSCFQGAELLSFLILREELGLQNKVQVIYASKVESINSVLEGFELGERRHNQNLSNYRRIEGKGLSDSFFIKQGNSLIPNKKLFVNTTHQIYNEIDEVMLRKSNLIIYRNRLLNFNRTLQIKVVNNLIKGLKPGGFLVLGVKERLVDDANRELFNIFNLKESIYKKKI